MKTYQAYCFWLHFVATDDFKLRVQISEIICEILQFRGISLKRLDVLGLNPWVYHLGYRCDFDCKVGIVGAAMGCTQKDDAMSCSFEVMKYPFQTCNDESL